MTFGVASAAGRKPLEGFGGGSRGRLPSPGQPEHELDVSARSGIVEYERDTGRTVFRVLLATA